MLNKLHISDFKSHLHTELELKPLTLLTGINSSGKSSVIQSLLLLRQSFRSKRLDDGLDLNGSLCSLGFSNEVLSLVSNSDTIRFLLGKDNNELDYVFSVENYESTFLPLSRKVDSDDSLALYSNNFQYISANRWGNRSSYSIDSYAVEKERQISKEYGQGELLGHFLNYYGEDRNFKIDLVGILHPSIPEERNLLLQAIAWEREISPRVTFHTIKDGSNMNIVYGFEGANDAEPLKNLKAENIGFGVSYSLSIIVAILSARPGSLLLIENPEAHLHPVGQSKLAELIAIAAQNDIQIIVETHSDHIVNGIRVAIKKKQLEKEKQVTYFFELNGLNITETTKIGYSDEGRILKYKKGFFTQFDEDLDKLLDL